MKLSRPLKRALSLAAITAVSAALTVSLDNVRFIQLLHLKARDFHFVIRGPLPVDNIMLITVDKKALYTFKELLAFWHPYYSEAIEAAAAGGAKALGLDVAFAIPVNDYVKDADNRIVEAVLSTMATMPAIISVVPEMMGQQQKFVVPVNLTAISMGQAAYANLTVDADDFVRTQELLAGAESPEVAGLRSLATRVAEKFIGEEMQVKDGQVTWRGRTIPTVAERTILINYAGGPDHFPRVSIADVIAAARAKQTDKLKGWFAGKAVLLGPDYMDDRHATPFYTMFTGGRWNTAGVEIHASTLRTLLTQEYLVPVPLAVRFLSIVGVALMTAILIAFLSATQAAVWLLISIVLTAGATHWAFRAGHVISTSELLLACLLSVLGSLVYRFLTAEIKGALFQDAVSVFVGKQLASSLQESGKISLSGKRQEVTILFSDIRGFTAFCEEKDPGVVVDLLNDYMGTMVKIIVEHNGSVNKFIGDGILAIFTDDDDRAKPGDHPTRATKCGVQMALAPGQFKTGVGIHTGPAVVGNVGSRDKMEYTVLGDTVNLASRLESLNKEMKTKLLISEATKVLLDGQVAVSYLGSVPVRGKTLPLNLFTADVLVEKKTEPKPAAEEVVAPERT